MSPQPTVGDLFAGAGGLAIGFHAAGFSPLFFNEIDETASHTFALNFPQATGFTCPIEDLTAERLRDRTSLASAELDMMVGGPPCQGFSINAPLRKGDDPRNHLFRHYIRLVLEGIRPKFVLLENVPGLVSLDHGKTLHAVKLAFERAGYQVIFAILNAAHYGVPQERWRLFFLGTRVPGVPLSFPEPTHYSLQRANFSGGSDLTFSYAVGKQRQRSLFGPALLPPVTVREAINDLPPIESGAGERGMEYISPPFGIYQCEMREGSKRLLNHECAGASPINFERIRHVRPGGSWRDIPHELLPKGMQRARRSDHTKRYGRIDPDAPSCTIMTKCDPHWGTVFHYEQDRIISVREAARLQSFPDRFAFTGSKVEQYRQVGNAVPPKLAQAIAGHVKSLLSSTSAAPAPPTASIGVRHAARSR